jgi:hypothetical protein
MKEERQNEYGGANDKDGTGGNRPEGRDDERKLQWMCFHSLVRGSGTASGSLKRWVRWFGVNEGKGRRKG